MNIAVCEITPRLDDEETLRRLDKLFSRVIAKVSDGEPLSLLLRGIDLEAESRKISTLFFARPAAAETTKIILKGILQKVLSGKDVYEHTLFRRDISFFLKNCADKNKTSPPLVKGLLAGPLRGLLKNISGSMSPQTKDFILCDQILPAMLDACENQFPGLVDSLSLYSVVEREINAMHPAEIEGVFYSFAGPYFKKIILYGWIGLFGGLLSYVVGCLLPLLP
jgi:hypothetical protein